MSLTDIKARIATVLEGVEGIGKVYPRMRLVNVEAVQVSDFVVNGVLNAWFVTRGAAELEEIGDIEQISAQWDSISIHGFYAAKDADESETEFDELADAALAAVYVDSKFPSLFSGTVKRAAKPKIRVIDYRHFGVSKVLCHHAEITIQTMSKILE